MFVILVLTGERAMLSEMDVFLTGILGGALSSVCLFAVMYFHFQRVFKDYFYNKNNYVMAATIKKLVAEVDSLKLQLKHINLDYYDNIVKAEYK